MFGDIELSVIENYTEAKEISENIALSTSGRKGKRTLDRVLKHLEGSLYTVKYRVTSAKHGELIFDTFKEAAEEFNQL